MQRILVVFVPVVAFLACDLEEIDHDAPSEAEETFPFRLADAYCSAVFACDPVNTCQDWPFPYTSEADCLDGERTALEETSARARDAGMTFDGDCVDRIIAQYAEVECDHAVRIDKRFGESYDVVRCQPYFGAVLEDEDPCFDIVGTELNNCGANLQCLDETCIPVDDSSGCGCDDGFMCEYASSSDECFPILGLGDVCRTAEQWTVGICPLDSSCWVMFDDEGILLSAVCVAATPLGGACEDGTECASYTCESEVCVPGTPWLCNEHVAPRRFR